MLLLSRKNLRISPMIMGVNVHSRKAGRETEMTRKQAALKAIELLSVSEENKEICEALSKIANGRLTEIWNEELVLESIQDFIAENGYYPTAKQMDADPMMPAHASAYIAMGMGYRAVKETYFPDVPHKEEYGKPTVEEWIEQFQELFMELGKPTEREFNEKRPEGTACASTWVRRAECKSWNDLLEKSGFEDCLRNIHAPHCRLEVTTTESDLSEAEYLKMEEDLKLLLA